MASGVDQRPKTAQYPDLKEIRKALFQSPGNVEDSTPDAIKAMLNRLQIEHDVDASLKALQRDEHEKRLKELRKLQENLHQDNWKYKPLEELIGLH